MLDAFGTLVRMEPPGPNLRRELERAGIPVSEGSAAAAFRAEISYYLRHHLDGRDAAALEQLRDRCAEVLRAALGEPRLEHATARRAMLAAIRFSPYPDAAPALELLRARGLRLAVASNWDCSLRGVVARAGLAELVDGIVCSAEVGSAKPAAQVFEAALRVVDARAEVSLHVGDSPAADVDGARAAGLRAVLLRRDAREVAAGEGSAVIARLTDLLVSN